MTPRREERSLARCALRGDPGRGQTNARGDRNINETGAGSSADRGAADDACDQRRSNGRPQVGYTDRDALD
jgi:hypothetical protein